MSLICKTNFTTFFLALALFKLTCKSSKHELYNIYSLIFYIFIVKINCDKKHETGLERLIKNTFVINSYNNLVRPVGDKEGPTQVFTELKFIQIDLVIYIF